MRERSTLEKFHKNGSMMRLAAVLLLLVMLSTVLLSGLLAKYTVTSSSKEQARVATFSVRAVQNTDLSREMMALGETDPVVVYAIDLENDSEVAVAYDITLELSKDLPEGVKVTLMDKDGNNSVKGIPIEGIFNTEYKFSDAGQMAPNTKTVKYLKFTPTDSTYDSLPDKESYEVECKFEVKVTFVQVD